MLFFFLFFFALLSLYLLTFNNVDKLFSIHAVHVYLALSSKDHMHGAASHNVDIKYTLLEESPLCNPITIDEKCHVGGVFQRAYV